MKKLIALTIVFAFAAIGCAAFNRLVNEHEFTMQLSVEAATARVLHEHPSWTGKAVAITGGALGVIDAKAVVDLAGIEDYVKGRIPWAHMLPEEQAVVSALISEVRKNLEDTLRAKNITAPELMLVEVRKVLLWINEAARRVR